MYRSVALPLLVALLAGCGATANIADSKDHAPSGYGAAASSLVANDPYVLGPGDRLRIKTYSDDQLNGEYNVGSSGYISVPLVGEVKAAGRTVRQLQRSVAAKMKGSLARKPDINIEIVAYRPVYIYGEVKKAGAYPYSPGLTVADAIAIAGGLTYRADENKIYIRHPDARAERIVTLGAPVRVSPGDNIRVSERMF